MPFYEYHCPDCDQTIERLERITAHMQHPCSCGGTAERIHSMFSFPPVFRTLVGQNNYKGNVPWEKPKTTYFYRKETPNG